MVLVTKLTGPVVTLIMLMVVVHADFVTWSQCGSFSTRVIPRGAHDHNATTLFLHMCDLTEITASDLKGLTNLQRINLDINEIQSIDPSVFKDVAQVTELEMRLNKLKAMPVFGASSVLPNVKNILLGANEISKLDNPKTFSSTKQLEILALEMNEIAYIHPDMFSGLAMLKTLSLYENKLTYIDDRTFVIPSLKELNLGNNVIEKVAVGAFRGSKLNTLYLQGNKLTHLPGDLLSGPGAELETFCYERNPWQCAELTKIVKREIETGMICRNLSKIEQRMVVACVS